MKIFKSFQFKNLVLFSVFLSLPAAWSETSQKVKSLNSQVAEEGLPSDVLDHLDNAPASCFIDPVLPNGETMSEFEKRTKGKISPGTEFELKGIKRSKLPKTIQQVNGVEIQDNNDFENLRKMTIEKTDAYDSPNGKIIDSYPKNFVVFLKAKKDNWFLVKGYWSRPCDTGWVREKNLIQKSRQELESLKIFGI